MPERDHYEVLKLHPSADHTMVQQAYWHLARKYKAAMDRDAFMEHAVDELNEAFLVLGSPELRADYDLKRNLMRKSPFATSAEPGTTKRVSIQVSFWSLPAWQGILAATAALALTIVALAAGVQPFVALFLGAIAVGASLVTLPSHFASSREAHWMVSHKRWHRDLRVVERCDQQVPRHHLPFGE